MHPPVIEPPDIGLDDADAGLGSGGCLHKAAGPDRRREPRSSAAWHVLLKTSASPSWSAHLYTRIMWQAMPNFSSCSAAWIPSQVAGILINTRSWGICSPQDTGKVSFR